MSFAVSSGNACYIETLDAIYNRKSSCVFLALSTQKIKQKQESNMTTQTPKNKQESNL